VSTFNVRIRYEPLRSVPYTSVSGVYAGVGSAFVNPVRLLKITNTTDADIIISFDGVNDQDILPARTSEIWDYGSNRGLVGSTLDQSQGERVYVKQVSAPTSGTVYVVVLYASSH
jgi:hypothetical protein